MTTRRPRPKYGEPSAESSANMVAHRERVQAEEATDQDDADLHGTIDEEITYRRWEGDAGAGFAGTTGVTLVKSVTVGSKTIRLYIEPKYTTPYGFWFKADRSDTGQRVNVAMVQAFCHFGLGQ